MTRQGALARAAVLLVVLAGCAGDGSDPLFDAQFDGDDEPPPETCPPSDTTGAPTLAEIQRNIFTPICSGCHIQGGIGPFRLDSEEHVIADTVNVPSLCALPECSGPSGPIARITPCDPDRSYLIWKVTGPPTFVIQGNRMPLGGPMLRPSEIDMLRAWIEAGAQP